MTNQNEGIARERERERDRETERKGRVSEIKSSSTGPPPILHASLHREFVLSGKNFQATRAYVEYVRVRRIDRKFDRPFTRITVDRAD